MNADEKAVLAANNDFYRAFSRQDLKSMQDLWSATRNIAVLHPGWPPLIGRNAVLSSWKRILAGGMSPNISCIDARANMLGDTAVVICTELLAEGELVATNIFVREDGRWLMIHHQAGPLPALSGPADNDALH